MGGAACQGRGGCGARDVPCVGHRGILLMCELRGHSWPSEEISGVGGGQALARPKAPSRPSLPRLARARSRWMVSWSQRGVGSIRAPSRRITSQRFTIHPVTCLNDIVALPYLFVVVIHHDHAQAAETSKAGRQCPGRATSQYCLTMYNLYQCLIMCH